MLNVYSILIIFTILIITVGLFPKLIQKKGLTGPCSGRYEKSQPLVLPTPKAGGHFVQGFIFVVAFVLAAFKTGTDTDYTGHEGIRKLIIFLKRVHTRLIPVYPVIACALCVGYQLYNLIKRVKYKNIAFRDSSYYNNLFDFQFGMWIATGVTLVILAVLYLKTRSDAGNYRGHSLIGEVSGNVVRVNKYMIIMAGIAATVSLGVFITSTILVKKTGACDSCTLSDTNCKYCPEKYRKVSCKVVP